MSNSTEQKQPSRSQDRENVRGLLMSMADTTWRMFAGPVVLVSAGLYADLKFQTKPWLTILGAMAGLGLSVLLVRRQLRGGQ